MTKSITVATQQASNFAEKKYTVGLDLGDRWSWYCVLDEHGELVFERKVSTTPKALREVFGGWYYAKGLAQALSEHAKPILSGEFQLEGSPGFELAGQQAIKGRLGSVVRAPSEAMSRATNLLYAGNYFGEINSLAARQAISEGLDGGSFHARQEYLAHHPTEAMQESAHKLAMTGEALAIQWPQIDLDVAVVRLEGDQTKNEEARIVPLPSVLVDLLPDVPSKTGPVFDRSNLRSEWEKGMCRLRPRNSGKSGG